MKKQVLIALFVLVSLCSGLIGYIIGFHVSYNMSNTPKEVESYQQEYDKEMQNESDFVGIYHTHNWNSREATLVLNEDGTYNHPSGFNPNDTWELKGNEILLYKNGSVQTAYVVNGGLMLSNRFFQKMD